MRDRATAQAMAACVVRIPIYTESLVQCSILWRVGRVCRQLRLKLILLFYSVRRLASTCLGALPLLDQSYGIPSCKNRHAAA